MSEHRERTVTVCTLSWIRAKDRRSACGISLGEEINRLRLRNRGHHDYYRHEYSSSQLLEVGLAVGVLPSTVAHRCSGPQRQLEKCLHAVWTVAQPLGNVLKVVLSNF